MKTSELKQLKQLSEAVVAAFPPQLTVDAYGRLYRIGVIEPVTMLTVFTAIEITREKLSLLDQTIQALEGRKAPAKE